MFFANILAKKILDARYWWPIIYEDTLHFCKLCDECQKNYKFDIFKHGQTGNSPIVNPIHEMRFKLHSLLQKWGVVH